MAAKRPKRPKRYKAGERVCDYQGYNWGTVAVPSGAAFTMVVWDNDPKQMPRRTHTVGLRRHGQKHPFLPAPYSDPKSKS